MKRSERLMQVYEFIRKCILEDGYPPTVREIGAAVGLQSTSGVHAYIEQLKEEGYLEKDVGKKRAIRLADKGGPVVDVPVLGRVTAGAPILAIEDIEEYIPFRGRRGGHELFALRVRGDSMIDAGIFDGDVIIAEKTRHAQNRQIVVALIGDEATVKRILLGRDGTVTLMPENPAYEPIISREVQVLGRVIASVRYFD